jgi:hypothetical protein
VKLQRPGVAVPLLLAGLAAVGGGLLAIRLLAQPDAGLVSPAVGSGGHVQRALGELVMRATGVSGRTEPLVLTSGELNEFLARHVESRRLPYRPLLVRAGEDDLQLTGRTSLGQLAGRSWIRTVLTWLPAAVRDLDLWVSVQGRLVLRQGELEFAVQRATLGRQPVPPTWLWRALDFDPREQLHWRLPRVVERIEVRPGQLVIYTRRHHGR